MDEKELQEKLASGEYSISPRSGRLRKRIRVKKKESAFSKNKVKKNLSRIMWVLMIIGFLFCLAVLLPMMNQSGPVNQASSGQNYTKTK
jgi:preprotein translocase subunit SecG